MNPRFVFPVLLALANGCGPGGPDPGNAADSQASTPPSPPLAEEETLPMVDLTGTTWRLATLAETQVAQDFETTLAFLPDGRVAGSGGCNRFSGAYQREGSTLSFGPLAATRMACPEPVMTQESDFFSLLEGGITYRRTADGLLELRPADGGPPSRMIQVAPEGS